MLISKNKAQRGASMVEYALGLGLLVAALIAAPVAQKSGKYKHCKTIGSSNNISAIGLLECSLKIEYKEYSKSIANPR